LLHNSAFEFLGIEGKYQAIDVPSGELKSFLAQNSSNFDYFSLTMPLKEEVLTLGYRTDGLVEKIQSANTLLMTGSDGLLTSTDGSGFLSALEKANLHTFSRVLILGAGGTARAVVGALDSIAREIHVLGRSSVRKAVLERAVSTSEFSYLIWNTDVDFSEYDLVVNTTPAGAADLLAESIGKSVDSTLFDVIYKPWPTVLAQRWRDRGGEVLSGLELLLYQGIHQLKMVLPDPFDSQSLADYLRPILNSSGR
jgi:shikimate dehydrogenase